MECPIVKTRRAGITLRSPRAAGGSTSRGRGSPHHRRRHTRFPAASQPCCSPSSIYLIINLAITINSWGCCSHVDQSSAVVRAKQGHVSSPGGLLSPGINRSGYVCCGCARLGSGGGSSLIPPAAALVLGVAGAGPKRPFLQCFPVAARCRALVAGCASCVLEPWSGNGAQAVFNGLRCPGGLCQPVAVAGDTSGVVYWPVWPGATQMQAGRG